MGCCRGIIRDEQTAEVCCRPENPNVFYEAGIAHTLGKHVVPITQNGGDVPADLRHHRYLQYLNNGEGLQSLERQLASRLANI
ncbi:hypothetical protein ASC96_28055 [Rhizobium sp. Root1204]|nr:hypothetical protein ASC96_28055 [Rhizobium sp. Root1204]